MEIGINYIWRSCSSVFVHFLNTFDNAGDDDLLPPENPGGCQTHCLWFTALALVSLESAERPNYFLYVHDDDTLRLELWQANSAFHQRATFFHHQSLWIPGYSAFELYIKKGFFIILTDASVKASKYDESEEFKHSSSFSIEGMVPEVFKRRINRQFTLWQNIYQILIFKSFLKESK